MSLGVWIRSCCVEELQQGWLIFADTALKCIQITKSFFITLDKSIIEVRTFACVFDMRAGHVPEPDSVASCSGHHRRVAFPHRVHHGAKQYQAARFEPPPHVSVQEEARQRQLRVRFHRVRNPGSRVCA